MKRHTFHTLEPADLDLEVSCATCDGHGTVPSDANWNLVECLTCHGSGRQLTELGRKVLDLVQRHQPPSLCPACWNRGAVPNDQPQEQPCPQCQTKGDPA